ncbi:DUF1194 domain-containing protein [Xinfangfangia pollutisoli]|uniref:DUF1194 domain-containing protein n=1 Tax=Xinfangfangia pollutisoli TaxID=2865960 RepID=UPI001CD5F37B|nr:DUF1194 domain-containing protein [Xinfangfangia pollutisoli]
MRARLALCLLCLLVAAPPARAACRLALALAMDVSRSVDARDFAIQTGGLADALARPDIARAFFAPAGDVALAVYEWSGETHQQVLIDWVVIARPEDLAPVIATLRGLRPPAEKLSTALGRGLAFGRDLLVRAPPCDRQVIDVSGDGRNNAGPTPERIYAQGGWEGITVNGLAIGSHELQLTEYYHASVIRGPGAFVELALRQSDYPEAIRKKLMRELTEAVSVLDCRRGLEFPTEACRIFR